ncbi:MAG: hypothetical protein Q9194_003046 [Teloschistes cf. exilis]
MEMRRRPLPPLLCLIGLWFDSGFSLCWIKSWSAIGDSYAAGIGAGEGPGTSDDRSCSRYGDAYPHLLDDLMDNKKAEFKFLACTGAISVEIKDQAKTLTTASQDLLTISAGGNDVAFSTVLKKCVYLTGTESACDSAFDAASSLIKTQLGHNIEDLLTSALRVMKDKGVVVYTLYAKFFNAVATGCNGQNWVLFDPTSRKGTNLGLKLTTQRRERMNQMVDTANQQIRTAIANSRPAFYSFDSSSAMQSYHPDVSMAEQWGKYYQSDIQWHDEASKASSPI